jgi:hypothetical protein
MVVGRVLKGMQTSHHLTRWQLKSLLSLPVSDSELQGVRTSYEVHLLVATGEPVGNLVGSL